MSDETWNRIVREHAEEYREKIGKLPRDVGNLVLDIHPDGILVKELVSKVLLEAAKKRADAGFSGSYSDGGAGQMVRELAAWISGLQKEIPISFEGLEKDILLHKDPEYQEYLKLKNKFEED
jgi:hypothetical protein